MVAKLKEARFLTSETVNGKRLLRVTTGAGYSGNVAALSDPVQGQAESPESDQEVTGKLPSGHRQVTTKSHISDLDNIDEQRSTTGSIDQSPSRYTRYTTGDIIETTTTPQPVVVSATPASKSEDLSDAYLENQMVTTPPDESGIEQETQGSVQPRASVTQLSASELEPMKNPKTSPQQNLWVTLYAVRAQMAYYQQHTT